MADLGEPTTRKAPLSVVALGGGTGLSQLLRGLKGRCQPTAIVAMADDGGSTGRLRDQTGCPALGDLRKCLAALADRNLDWFDERLKGGRSLRGHSVGNIALLSQLQAKEGDLLIALHEFHELLQVQGRVLPATTSLSELIALTEAGELIFGESKIGCSKNQISRVSFGTPCPATESALQAIAEADMITIGPGSLFTSICAALLPRGMSSAIRSSRAIKVFIQNMSRDSETRAMAGRAQLTVVEEILGRGTIDYVLLDDQCLFHREFKTGCPTSDVANKCDRLGHEVVFDRLAPPDSVRHDSQLLGQAVIHLAAVSRFAGN